uniref:C-type lectin domain-containing protein n=1 Tax=Catharus ustulatus TaxID=91951 RepID=A0A8C3VBF5_CATUS
QIDPKLIQKRLLPVLSHFLSLPAGQTVCRRGTQKPCYKIVYFHDASRRSSYEEAHLACRADGGHLVSIESPAEQRLIESFIRSLLASDGDFWIGLRRRKEEEDNSTECHSFYSWADGSSSKFRWVPNLGFSFLPSTGETQLFMLDDKAKENTRRGRK